VTLAAANAPGLSVLSGESAAIADIERRMSARDIGCSILRTSHAFHSAMMDPAVDAFREYLRGVRLRAPKMTLISTRSGERMTDEQALSPDYWALQLREPVRFMKALQSAGSGETPLVFLEVGPGIAASAFAAQTFAERDAVAVIASLGRRADAQDETRALLAAAGRAWTRGVALDWKALHDGAPRRRVPLPTYRFERTRYWLASAPASATVSSAPAGATDGARAEAMRAA